MSRRDTVLLLLTMAACSPPPAPVRGERRLPIVGGIDEPNHRYVVAVGGARGAFCSGTVISKHTVLTAGHCIGNVTRVFFGPSVGGATTIDVVAQVRNPLYADICDNDATFDLGVVQLAAAAPTQAAPLLRARLDNSPKY